MQRVDVVTKAVELLARRERSTAQLRAALTRSGYSDDEVESAVVRVRELGYLNETRAASGGARQLLLRGKSRLVALQSLVSQGIDVAVAETAIEQQALSLGHSDEVVARRLLARFRATGVKAARLLASRGFDEDLIHRLVGIDSPPEGL